MNLAVKPYYLLDKENVPCFPSDIEFGREDMSPEKLNQTKLGLSYGLSVAKAIEYDWYGGGDCLFLTRQRKFRELRKYAMGKQEIKQYKDILCFEGGEEKWNNLDWTPLKIAPKFIDLVVNGIKDRLYAMKAEAIDTAATNKRRDEKKRVQSEMVSKPFLDDALKLFGIKAQSIPDDKLPLDDEELDFYIENEFQLPIEIAVEKVMKLIMQYNTIDTINDRVIRDLAELGLGGMRHYIDPVGGIKVKYVNPENLLHSYTENPDFEGVYYFGEVERLSISELKRMYIGNNIDWEKVQKQGVQFSQHLRRTNTSHSKNLDNFYVDVMHFSYRTSKEIVFKKKLMKGNAFKMIRRDAKYNPPERESTRHKRIDTSVDTWMEGTLLLGTDILLDWKEASNIVRPKGLLHNPSSNFVMYAPKFYDGDYDSLVERMIPLIDGFQLNHMKLQQLISKVAPDGMYFDVEALSGIDLGDGGAYTPKEAMRLYMETGNVVGRSKNDEGENVNRGIQPNYSSGQSDKIRNIITAMNFYMGQLVESIGANMQATNPDADALVGVQKLAALNSNQATSHIRDGVLRILRGVGSGVVNRLKDAWEYAEFRDFLINALGRTDYDTLEALKDLSLHDVAVFIELKPDEEERLSLLEDISIALKNGEIKVPDKIDIMNKDNFKDASQLLKVRIKRYEKLKHQQEAEKIQMNEESQIRIAQASAAAKTEAEQMKMQGKMMEIQAQSEAKMRENEHLAIQKSLLMDKEFQYKMGIAGQEVQAKMGEKKYMEDRKDDRERMKATHQSEQSYARKNNLPPQNFESQFDNMEGLEI